MKNKDMTKIKNILVAMDILTTDGVVKVSDAKKLGAISYLRFELLQELGIDPLGLVNADNANNSDIKSLVHASLTASEALQGAKKAIDEGADPILAAITNGFLAIAKEVDAHEKQSND